MSTEIKSRNRQIAHSTLADVLDKLPMATNLSERRRKELASDVRSFCRIAELPVDRVIASTPILRQLVVRARPTAKRISRARRSNILSGLRKALHVTGIRQTSLGRLSRPAHVWEELLNLRTSEKRRIVFSRFARYCTELAIIPEKVDDAIIGQYLQALDNEAFSDPAAKITRLCRAWNKAAGSIASWPQHRLTVPNRTLRYSLPWSAYPKSLRAQVECYLAQCRSPDPLDPYALAPVKPSTVVTREKILRELAAARVVRGTPAAKIGDLGDLIRPAALLDSLRFFIDRAGNTVPRRVLHKAILARSIARNFLRLAEAEILELDSICKLINRRFAKHTKMGLTEQNQRRLTQFLDDKNVDALRDLPHRLHAQGKRSVRNACR
jgi:hypothetical protein